MTASMTAHRAPRRAVHAAHAASRAEAVSACPGARRAFITCLAFLLLQFVVAASLSSSRSSSLQVLAGWLMALIGILYTSSGAALRELPRAVPTRLPAQVLITDRS
jgi:hypothetical protein